MILFCIFIVQNKVNVMITSKNPALVPVPCEGSARFYVDTCCKTEAGVLIMSKRHGLSQTSIYHRWVAMIQRCTNPKTSNYKYYGGRSIVLCDEWKNDFYLFYNYVMKLPNALKAGYTIDRINNNGNYEPGNIRWSTRHEQGVNRRIQSNNTSGYIGVTYNKQYGKWQSAIHLNGKYKFIGVYDSPRLAAISRDRYLIDNGLTEYGLQIISLIEKK